MHPFFAFGLPHGWELFGIIALVVLLFGAEKIPKLARGLGKSLGEFKKAKAEFDKEIHAASMTDETKPPLENKLPAPVTPPDSVPTDDGLTKKT